MNEHVRLRVYGRVQGVFFRQSTLDQARTLGISGRVANEADGSVQIEAQGEPEKLESLIIWCRKGPPQATVTELKIEWLEKTEPVVSGFRILR